VIQTARPRDGGSHRNRSCGECRACCVVLGFEAGPDEASFAKPAGEPCRHLCPMGCSIYSDRPPVCRRFRCAWLQERSLPAALRPDRCGVMFAMNDSVLGPGFAVYAYELTPGAADRRPVTRLIERVAEEAPVILVRADGRREVFTADATLAAHLPAAESG
jgi:hypothetical protein